MFRRGTAARRRPQGFVDPCIPTLATKPPVGPQWIHEIKHDGYRLIVCRRADRGRVFTRRRYDWTERYPLIREAMLALPQDATIDGEAVVCDPMGVANFELLHSREHDLRPTGTRWRRPATVPARAAQGPTAEVAARLYGRDPVQRAP